MKKITETELAMILEKHAKWLKDETGGERADLSSANLRSANLSYADLRSANLRSANLRSANLRYANLSSANLSSANLRSANLRYANLSYANLSYANLRSADLDFASWPLWCGSRKVKVDDRIFSQLLNHITALDHPEAVRMRKLSVCEKYSAKHPNSAKMLEAK